LFAVVYNSPFIAEILAEDVVLVEKQV